MVNSPSWMVFFTISVTSSLDIFFLFFSFFLFSFFGELVCICTHTPTPLTSPIRNSDVKKYQRRMIAPLYCPSSRTFEMAFMKVLRDLRGSYPFIEQKLRESNDVLNNWKVTLAIRACEFVNKVNDRHGPLTNLEVDEITRMVVERFGPATTRDFHQRLTRHVGSNNTADDKTHNPCPICLEHMTQENATTLTCEHNVHTCCFAKWGVSSSKGVFAPCPLCRLSTSPTFVNL